MVKRYVNESLKPKRASLSRAAPPTSAIDLLASDPLGRWLSSGSLFADTEIAEDHIQDVLHVDATR